MTEHLSIALCQINPTVGDIRGNSALVRASRAKARELGADLAVFPELCLTGYPPEDLILRTAFLDLVKDALDELTKETADGGPALLVGAPLRDGKGRYNAALLLDGGTVVGRVLKHHLPNYGVFDEKRVFDVGPLTDPIPFRGIRLGVMVCEDMWFPNVAQHLAERGAEALVIPNGSPYDVEKDQARLFHARRRVTETKLPLVYVNQICGQDELVFDGASFALNGDGSLRVQAPLIIQ